MPKPGFTAITVSKSLKERLSNTAKALGYRSIPALIESLLYYTQDLRSSGVGLRGFKSRPPHQTVFEKKVVLDFFTSRSNAKESSKVLVPVLVIDYWAVKDQFLMWLRSRGLSQEHYVEKMIGYLDRFAKTVREPIDVVALFDGLSDSQKRHLANGLRNLFNFYEVQGLASKRLLDLLRRNLPKVSVGVDLKVPEPDEVIHSLRMLKGSGRYFALYNLMLDSGLRLTEGVRLYNSLVNNELKAEQHKGFYVIPLSYFRDTKLAYYGFLTEFSLKIVTSQDKVLRYKKIMGSITKRFKGVVSWKYLRKFAFDTMTNEEMNIPESVADFIQGRVPKTVGARHYMKLKRKAIQFYPRYAEYITELRRKARILG